MFKEFVRGPAFSIGFPADFVPVAAGPGTGIASACSLGRIVYGDSSRIATRISRLLMTRST